MALRLVGEETGGGAPTGASYVTTQAETGLTAEKVLGTDVIMSGTLAARPAASIAGRLYFATDDAGGTLYRDTGAAWVKLAAGLTEVLADAVVPAGVMRDVEHAADAHVQALTGPITRLRTGTAAARPGTGNTEGDVWWATDTNVLSLWDGAAWVQVYPAAAGALTRVGGSQTEQSTTQTGTPADLVTISGLSIAVGTPVKVMLNYRKTAGAADVASIGLKLNATTVRSATAVTTSVDAARHGMVIFEFIYGRANYLLAGVMRNIDSNASFSDAISHFSTDMPTATLTSLVILGMVGNAAITLSVQDVQVYTYAVS